MVSIDDIELNKNKRLTVVSFKNQTSWVDYNKISKLLIID